MSASVPKKMVLLTSSVDRHVLGAAVVLSNDTVMCNVRMLLGYIFRYTILAVQILLGASAVLSNGTVMLWAGQNLHLLTVSPLPCAATSVEILF